MRTLLSLYVRAGASVANLVLRVAVRGADLAADAVRTVAPSPEQPVWSESEDGPVWSESEDGPVWSESEDAVLVPPEPAPEPRGVDYDLASPERIDESRVKTIDDEPKLVAEVAEPGAEDGASAELEVDEPWDGYDDLAADDVIERIRQADTAELAVVELYERSHKQRRTVLAAAERRQKELANAPS